MSDGRPQPDLTRAEAAARAYLAGQAAGTSFRPLDPDDLKGAARPGARRAPWLVAAACLAAALIGVPLALRPGGPIAATPEPTPPPAALAWSEVADPPLSPRFGALTAWLGEEFLVVGGWTGGPCPPGALCDMAPPDTRDGARYHPATNAWRPIAAAPAAFGRGYATSAAALGAFYAVSHADEGSFWRYDPGTDAWQQRTAPPAWGELVGDAGALLLVTGDQAPAGYRYDEAADSWAALPAGPVDGCTERQGFPARGRLVLLAECGSPTGSGAGSDAKVATLDLAAGTWSEPVALDAAVSGRAVHTGGRLVWPDPLTPASSFHSPGIFDISTAGWREVPVDQPAGPLAFRGMVGSTGYLVLDGLGLVAANGHLLDAATGAWLPVPDPGTPQRWDAVRAAGPDALLDCFGYEYTDADLRQGRFVPGCRLLGRPGVPQPTTGEPTSGPTPEPTAPAGPGWQQVLQLDGPVPTDPLLVEAQGRYYLMGGYLLDDSLDDVQLRQVRRFDPATGSWQDLAELPEAAVSRPYTLAADVAGAVIYVHLSFEESGELWAYDTLADAWTKVGPTDETEHYLATEDGLVRVRLPDRGTAGAVVELLVGDRWDAVPAPPAVTEGPARVLRLDDHRIAVVAQDRVAILDTAVRQWGDWSPPAQVADLVALGVDGAAVFVDTAAPAEREPTDSSAPEVAVLRDGEWSYLRYPLVGDAPDAGLAPATGPGPGQLAVVRGRLLDLRTGQWQEVPPLPGADADWRTRQFAAGADGMMTCLPERIPATGEASVIPACYFLAAR